MTIDIPFVLNSETFSIYLMIEGVTYEEGGVVDRLLSWIDDELFSDSDLFDD